MPKRKNRWESIGDRLAETIIDLSDKSVRDLRGGERPPWVVPLPQREQLADYLLLSQPDALLLPEEIARKQDLWQARYAEKSRADIAEWCLAMETMRMREVGPESEPEMDLEEVEEDAVMLEANDA